jgi:hypothetical protein
LYAIQSGAASDQKLPSIDAHAEIHHSIIVELNIPSYRLVQAQNSVKALGDELPLPPGAAEAPSGSGQCPPRTSTTGVRSHTRYRL